jgi:1-acyl-sn-glycerol-3-phosphate acyltransferase
MFRAVLVALFLVPYTAVAALVSIAWARLSGSPWLMYRFGHLGVRTALLLAGTRFDVVGREHVGDGRNTAVTSNHISHLDAPVLFDALDLDVKAIVKKEIFGWPFLGRVLKEAGFVAVDRSDRVQATSAVDATAVSLRAGNTFLVFPEGTRSRTGELGVFKKGAFVAAIAAGSRVVPVAVHGTKELMPRGGFRIRPGTVRVRVLDPVDAGQYSYADRDLLVREVRERIAAALAELGAATGGEPPRR